MESVSRTRKARGSPTAGTCSDVISRGPRPDVASVIGRGGLNLEVFRRPAESWLAFNGQELGVGECQGGITTSISWRRAGAQPDLSYGLVSLGQEAFLDRGVAERDEGQIPSFACRGIAGAESMRRAYNESLTATLICRRPGLYYPLNPTLNLPRQRQQY